MQGQKRRGVLHSRAQAADMQSSRIIRQSKQAVGPAAGTRRAPHMGK